MNAPQCGNAYGNMNRPKISVFAQEALCWSKCRDMSNFSDEEDKQLIQLVRWYHDKKRPIDWIKLAKKMAKTGKSRLQLQNRLKTLKRTYGPEVRSFPKRFYNNNTLEKQRLRTLQTAEKKPQHIKRRSPSVSIQAPIESLLLLSRTASALQSEQVDLTSQNMCNMCQNVQEPDLHQCSGLNHLDGGEVHPIGGME